MLWIIQGNLNANEGLNNLIQNLIDKNIDYKLVKTVPFTDIVVDFDVDINQYSEEDIPKLNLVDKNVVTFGSYSLALAAKKFGWKPGSFINDNYEFKKWKEGWGSENLLNGDAIQNKVKNIKEFVPEYWNKIFVRPTEDTKSFAGQVLSIEDFNRLIKNIMNNTDRNLDTETDIIISKVKPIHSEYRLFIVDKKVVTGSLYKLGDLVITSEIVPLEVIEYAYKMLDIWNPDKAFVLDIAITEDEGLKIIEINNINSSGFYKADISLIVEAINNIII